MKKKKLFDKFKIVIICMLLILPILFCGCDGIDIDIDIGTAWDDLTKWDDENDGGYDLGAYGDMLDESEGKLLYKYLYKPNSNSEYLEEITESIDIMAEDILNRLIGEYGSGAVVSTVPNDPESSATANILPYAVNTQSSLAALMGIGNISNFENTIKELSTMKYCKYYAASGYNIVVLCSSNSGVVINSSTTPYKLSVTATNIATGASVASGTSIATSDNVCYRYSDGSKIYFILCGSRFSNATTLSKILDTHYNSITASFAGITALTSGSEVALNAMAWKYNLEDTNAFNSAKSALSLAMAKAMLFGADEAAATQAGFSTVEQYAAYIDHINLSTVDIPIVADFILNNIINSGTNEPAYAAYTQDANLHSTFISNEIVNGVQRVLITEYDSETEQVTYNNVTNDQDTTTPIAVGQSVTRKEGFKNYYNTVYASLVRSSYVYPPKPIVDYLDVDPSYFNPEFNSENIDWDNLQDTDVYEGLLEGKLQSLVIMADDDVDIKALEFSITPVSRDESAWAIEKIKLKVLMIIKSDGVLYDPIELEEVTLQKDKDHDSLQYSVEKTAALSASNYIVDNGSIKLKAGASTTQAEFENGWNGRKLTKSNTEKSYGNSIVNETYNNFGIIAGEHNSCGSPVCFSGAGDYVEIAFILQEDGCSVSDFYSFSVHNVLIYGKAV